MKTIKKNWEIKQRINIETYLKKIKTKRKNIEKKTRYGNMPEEKKQKLKEYQKSIQRQKSLNLIMNQADGDKSLITYDWHTLLGFYFY